MIIVTLCYQVSYDYITCVIVFGQVDYGNGLYFTAECLNNILSDLNSYRSKTENHLIGNAT